MAHIAKLGALTDELVTVLTSTSPQSNSSKFNIYRESALRNLRYHNHPRTNQFDVTSRLNGLEEKFRVYNEDPLADALKERLHIVSKTSAKWTPEILHLLLELSDKPVSKSNVNDLEYLKEPKPAAGPPLKWKDIVAEDPLLREKDVWRNIDFGVESSEGEDEFQDCRSDISGATGTTEPSSIDEEVHRRPEDYFVDRYNKEELDGLRAAQFWHRTRTAQEYVTQSRKTITELQAIREVLFMLFGLPTSLFEQYGKMRSIRPSQAYDLRHASIEAFFEVCNVFADQGSALMNLRSWVNRPQTIPLLQVLQDSIAGQIKEFENCLSSIQRRFVAPTEDIIVSLTSLQAEIGRGIRPLLQLSKITKLLDAEPYGHAFRYLELLHDETCKSQMAGDDELYRFFGKIFFECFQVYLRPIRNWMEDGDLAQGDKVFFVSEADGEGDPASLWQSRFKLRKTKAGVLHAPKFLNAAAHKIFNTGKSVVVLKQLNRFSLHTKLEPSLDVETTCNPSLLSLAPFSELFDLAFEAWIQSKHHFTSVKLRQILYDSCGLHAALDALSQIYFMADGATSSVFTNSIFDKLDTLNKSWNDRFTLTELAQSTFGSINSVSADHLHTTLLPLPRKRQDVERCRRSVKTLAIIELKYSLSWPIRVIVTQPTIPSYQKIFTFLLQVRRSSHILSRQCLITDPLTTTSSSDERALYYSLRTQLLWFTQTLYYYLANLVLAPNSKRMCADLKNAEDVDAMINIHTTYIKATIDQALLGAKLELIHKTILTILDLSIKLEDARAANTVVQEELQSQQQEMLDLSFASMDLHPPKRKKTAETPRLRAKEYESSSSDDEDKEVDVDLSILSATYEDDPREVAYIDRLRNMKQEFDRLVQFIASGLRGVARAGGGEGARSWDVLGEMLEFGIRGAINRYS